MLEGAIFDIDGTLIDSVDAHAEAWSLAFAENGRHLDVADARSQIGKGGDNLLPVFLDEATLKAEGSAFDKAHGRIFLERYRPHMQPFPMVRELFQALADRGVRLALASSSERADLEHYAQLMGIKDLLHSSTANEDAERSKPDPDIFEVAFKRLQPMDVRRTLAFGDSPYDAQAASAVGLRTVGLACGGFPDADLKGAGMIRIYRNPAEMLERLDEIMALV